jgi:hypothetical protein
MSEEHPHPSDVAQPTAKEAYFFLTILSNMKNKPDVSLLSPSADPESTCSRLTFRFFKSLHFTFSPTFSFQIIPPLSSENLGGFHSPPAHD